MLVSLKLLCETIVLLRCSVQACLKQFERSFPWKGSDSRFSVMTRPQEVNSWGLSRHLESSHASLILKNSIWSLQVAASKKTQLWQSLGLCGSKCYPLICEQASYGKYTSYSQQVQWQESMAKPCPNFYSTNRILIKTGKMFEYI